MKSLFDDLDNLDNVADRSSADAELRGVGQGVETPSPGAPSTPDYSGEAEPTDRSAIITFGAGDPYGEGDPMRTTLDPAG